MNLTAFIYNSSLRRELSAGDSARGFQTRLLFRRTFFEAPVYMRWAAEGKPAAHFVCYSERCFEFPLGHASQLRDQFAAASVIEHISSDANQLLPIMPFADGIFALTESVEKLLIWISFRRFQHVAKLFNSRLYGCRLVRFSVFGSESPLTSSKTEAAASTRRFRCVLEACGAIMDWM